MSHSLIEANRAAAELMLKLFVKDYRVEGFESFLSCFRDPDDGVPGNVVAFLNHGPPQSLMAVLPLLIHLSCEHGLQNERPGIIFHRSARYLPIFRHFFARLSSGNLATNVHEAAAHLRAGDISMYGTMPEGLNSLFDYDHPVGPFDKNGLIVAGLEASSKFILCVHRGTEAWYHPFPLGLRVTTQLERIIGHELTQTGAIRLPGLPIPISLRMRFVRYTPALTAEALAQASKVYRRKLVADEAERMRQEVIRIWDSLA